MEMKERKKKGREINLTYKTRKRDTRKKQADRKTNTGWQEKEKMNERKKWRRK